MTPTPTTELDERYSSPGATAVDWAQGEATLTDAELFWISTVRPDGRPHVTPLVAVWLDGALYFTTGADERKGRNLADSPHVVLTTGSNRWNEGLDVVVEGDAVRITDDEALATIA